MKLIKTIAFCCIVLCGITSCDKEQKFQIKGEIVNASGEVLYFEHIGVSGIVLLDSMTLKDNGRFSFKQARPEAPDFYRLRLNNKLINLAVDSTETITIKADKSTDYAREYTIEGSENCLKIKELTLLQLQTEKAYNDLLKELEQKTISNEEYQQQALKVINDYKQEASKYILSVPSSSVAYFALFQQVNNLLIFGPYNKEDNRMYSTVATSWDMYYGNSTRAQHLHALTIRALKEIRGQKSNIDGLLEKIEVVDALSYFEIELPDLHGNIVKLSDAVQKGSVILLDFTSYQSSFSPAHNMNLGEIYEKYHRQGVDIFQVSLDADLHLWQNAAANIPWIALRDPENVYSRTASTYNVRNLPTTFILNRKGEIIKRLEQGDDILAEIKKVL